MEHCYYELTTAPDFSLSKYASLSETGPSGVLNQHQAFWRQLNQWGKLFNGSIHFIYKNNPDNTPGERLKLVIRFDAPDQEAKRCIEQIMEASILAPYYDSLVKTGEDCLDTYAYPWQVNLLKKERFISSASNEKESFYIASEWKMNTQARLYSMLRIMEASNAHCAYCVDVYPVDYSRTLENSLTYIIPHLRELNSFKVKTGQNSVSSGGRDENAKKALDFYEDLLDDLTGSPHCLVNVQVLGTSDAVVKQILDAAACEALQEGNHDFYSEKFSGNIWDATTAGFGFYSDINAPESLEYLPHLMTLEQLVPFAVLPVLYPGETIEMPKETVPKKQSGMLIGHDTQKHEIYFPWKNLSKHTFMAGMPGSGKTNTMMYLISEMHRAGIPVLVLEPAKREYRSLTILPDMSDVSLFSPCANSMFPIHINPFEFPQGMKLADHINRLLDIFNGTFQLDPPMPMLLTEGIQACYESLSWLPGMINRGELGYPTMSMLYTQIERLLDKYEYAPEVRSNLKSILQVRIGSLLSREMGDIFDVSRSTFPPEQWLEKSAVIELASLGTGPSNFLMLTIMTLVRETLDIKAYDPDKNNGRPRHVIFLEEAHNLIASTSVQPAGGLDPKISATAYITRMLAEVRALGEGIVIADQLPTAMASEVVKNTSLKFGLRLTSQDERSLLGATMSADEIQMERMGIFNPGCCLVSYEGLQKPFEMQIPKFKGDAAVDDEHLLQAMLSSPVYHANMQESAEIMAAKYSDQRKELKRKNRSVLRSMELLRKQYDECKYDIMLENDEAADYTPTEKAADLLKQRRKVLNEYSKLMEQWCRLTLDVLLYLGVTAIRRVRLEHSEEITGVSRARTVQAHNKWFDLIMTL